MVMNYYRLSNTMNYSKFRFKLDLGSGKSNVGSPNSINSLNSRNAPNAPNAPNDILSLVGKFSLVWQASF